MAKFRIRTEVTSVEGWQHWIVEAADAAEAIQKHKDGVSEFEEEDISVMSLGRPEVIGEVRDE